MAKGPTKALIEALRCRDLEAVTNLVRSEGKAARSAQVVNEAARQGWTRALELCAQHGADLDASWRGYRPLHALIQEAPHRHRGEVPASRVSCLRWLLENGADPELLGGFPPIRAVLAAAFAGQRAYVDELLRAGAVVDGTAAAALGDLRRVRALVQEDPGFAEARDPGGLTALHCCAASRLREPGRNREQDLLAIGTALLDAGADPDAVVRGWGHDLDVAYFAIASGQRELFVLLLERGADPTAALASAVWGAEWDATVEFAELALTHGARIDLAVHEGRPLLNQLIRWGQVRQTLWLLGKGADPNVADDAGWTSVHRAASRGNERMMQAVLEAGGDRSREDDQGRTPLDIARGRRRPKIVALLGR